MFKFLLIELLIYYYRLYIDIYFRCLDIFCGVGLTPPLGPFFKSPRFRFLRSLCSSPLGPCESQHCGHISLLCIPRMIHEGDCGVIGGANDDCRGNRRTRRKPAPAPLCPTTIPHDQVRFRTPDRSGGKPATNRLSYGAATAFMLSMILKIKKYFPKQYYSFHLFDEAQ
jgi:hypothetical protein